MRAILLLFIVMYTSLSLAHAFESVSQKTPSAVLIDLSDDGSENNEDYESIGEEDCTDENIPTTRYLSLISFNHIQSEYLDTRNCLFESNQLKRPPKTA